LKAAQSKNDQQIAEAKTNLHTAELRLAQLRVGDPSPQVVIAEVALERAQTVYADALDEYNKSLNRPWETEKAREAYTRRLHEAELSLKVAQAQHQQAVNARQSNYYSIQMQEEAVARARQQLEQLESGIDIESTRLTVERLKTQLDSSRLIAPFDGYVMSISLLKGRAVEVRRPVAIVSAIDKLEVSAKLTDQQMVDLVEGMPATVRLPRQTGQGIQGQIRRLPYSFSGGGSTTVLQDEDLSTRIALTMSGEVNLQVGDVVEVVIVLDRKDNVLWLPPLAIRAFEGRRFVVVQDGPAQRRVDVQVGLEGKERVEIKEGLTDGQIVIGP
jgi:RND family efflux transporter MFP subunit